MSTQLELTGSDGTPWWWCPDCDDVIGDCYCTTPRFPDWAQGWDGPWRVNLIWTRRSRAIARPVEHIDTGGLT